MKRFMIDIGGPIGGNPRRASETCKPHVALESAASTSKGSDASSKQAFCGNCGFTERRTSLSRDKWKPAAVPEVVLLGFILCSENNRQRRWRNRVERIDEAHSRS